MIRARLITAVVLAPTVIALTLLLDDFWFGLVLGGVVLLGLREWAALKSRGVAAVLAGAVPLAMLFVLGHESPSLLLAISGVAACVWIGLSVDLLRNGLEPFHSVLNSYPMGVFLLSGAWSAAVLIHGWADVGPITVIATLCIVWAADSFAYFAGKRFGRKRLAPALSPGKSVEGVVGGLAGTMAVAVVFGYAVLHLDGVKLAAWIGCGLAAGLISVAGDLYESRLKRIVGVKDSGRLLPGHGGILDRIDSVIAAMPVIATGWSIIR
ncbi:MAG: phosphatidate cytidylyltransferase [Gammaproteobacteria bacterium]|nr:phosphatidate cytidylyltransferase [Gammaproteobacteria bacterium]